MRRDKSDIWIVQTQTKSTSNKYDVSKAKASRWLIYTKMFHSIFKFVLPLQFYLIETKWNMMMGSTRKGENEYVKSRICI